VSRRAAVAFVWLFHLVAIASVSASHVDFLQRGAIAGGLGVVLLYAVFLAPSAIVGSLFMLLNDQTPADRLRLALAFAIALVATLEFLIQSEKNQWFFRLFSASTSVVAIIANVLIALVFSVGIFMNARIRRSRIAT
jgi:hypothetical protein